MINVYGDHLCGDVWWCFLFRDADDCLRCGVDRENPICLVVSMHIGK